MGALLGVGALTRGERRIGWGAVASGVIGIAAGVAATQASAQHLDDAVQLVHARVRLPVADHRARLRRDRRHVLGAKRRREHRARGDDADGRVLRRLGSRPHRLVVAGVLIGMLAGGLLALVHGVFCIHLRADQIVVGTAIIFLAYGITGFLYNDIYGDQGTPGDLPRIPDVNLDWLGSIPPDALGRFLEESLRRAERHDPRRARPRVRLLHRPVQDAARA